MNEMAEKGETPVKKAVFLRWLRAVGFFRGFLVVSLVPVSLGAMIALRFGAHVDVPMFGLTLVAVWLAHAGANLLNDYNDHLSGTDDINEVRTPFSGGTRVIQDGLLLGKSVRNAGWIAYALATPILAYLGVMRGPVVFGMAAFGVLSGILYTQKPIWLSYRGVGEVMIAANFGPLLVAFAAYIQLGRVPLAAWVVGGIVGLWAMAIITANELPDYEADKRAGKRNIVVFFGPQIGLYVWAAILWTSVAILFGGIVVGILPKQAVIALPIVFAVLALTRKPSERLGDLDSIIDACRWTILSFIGLWILLMAGFYLSPVVYK